MELVDHPTPIGQRFILRSHLRDVFNRSQFVGDSWRTCVEAFLACPGTPLLPLNSTNHAPASFFLKLNTDHEPNPPDESEAESRRQLAALGEQIVWQLLGISERMCWVIYLDDGITEVVAFSGRPLPGPSFTREQDTDDIESGTTVRSLVTGLTDTRITKIYPFFGPMARPVVELAAASEQRYYVTFERPRSIMPPDPEHEEIIQVDELLGPTGRTWFLFRPTRRTLGRRQLTIQAESAEWTVIPAATDDSTASRDRPS